MKRLTFYDDFGRPCYRLNGCVYQNKIAERLAAYEDAEEQGRLVVLPCKPHGDLIDRKELLKYDHQHYEYLSDEFYVTVRDIESAPTIIEANEGAEGGLGYRNVVDDDFCSRGERKEVEE